MRGTRLLVPVAVLVFAMTGNAMAAQRVASPGGSPSAPCTVASPCDVATAITGAQSGDDVLIESGDYGSSASPMIGSITASSSNLVIHGPASGATPRIFLSTAPSSGSADGLILETGTTLRDVEVHNVSTAAGADAIYASDGALIDHVVASTAGITDLSSQPKIAAALIVTGPGSVFDTVAFATNSGPASSATETGGEALRVQGDGGSDTVRNTTVVAADGGSNFAMDARGLSGTTTVTLENTIVVGANGLAVSAGTASPGTTMTVNADHDVISGVPLIDGGTYNADSTVSSTTPVFVNAGANDYHEAPNSSSTIDKGAAVPASDPASDIDGDLRTVGAAPDIGADELPVAPSATADGVSDIGIDHATVLGSVTAGGGVSRAWLEYGTTEPLPKQTPASAVAAAADQRLITFSLTGLTPQTTYHARITIVNQAGQRSSDEVTFTTSSAPATVTPAGPSTTTASPTGSTFAVPVPVAVQCPAHEQCATTVTVTVPATALGGAQGAAVKRVVIGAATLTLRGGQRVRIEVKLNKVGARLLRRKRHLTARFALRVKAGKSRAVIRAGAITIKLGRR